MASENPSVDVVIVGFGWTGAIMAMELANAGLQVLALERGEMQDTAETANYPNVIDELAYSTRGKLLQDLSKETVTIRHSVKDTAVPYRQHGAFLLGNGVGGAGFHWNGMSWRAFTADLRLRSHYQERYGASFIAREMTIQDYPVTFEELEPYFAQWEEVAAVSGKAGNINNRIISGGNRWEAPRSGEYPLPPLKSIYGAQVFAKAADELGFKAFPVPAANASAPYTNQYGVRLGPCNFCGFCEGYGCYMYSKASPQTSILPALKQKKNFTLKTRSHVLRVNTDSTGKLATGVTYIDPQGQEVFQPAKMVLLCAFQMHNVRLLLLSNIGKPYDPVSGEGVVGKNYAYHMNSSVNVLLPKDTQLNPYIGAGAAGSAIDDFNGDNFDHGPLGFIGGASVYHLRTGGRPIGQSKPLAGGPNWGKGWKASVQQDYHRTLPIYAQGSVMSYRDTYLSLDPTYKDAHGQPLLRMTFDWHENEFAMIRHAIDGASQIAKAVGGDIQVNLRKSGSHFDTRAYQSTHTTGGAIMGDSPANSVVNRYLQSWDVHNLFVMGACVFPQNLGYNPTGLVAALTYWSVDHIKKTYLKNPGPLVQA
jgi:gluconate 2-dehydrogenase alpha chain